jgi:hypothetical protein
VRKSCACSLILTLVLENHIVHKCEPKRESRPQNMVHCHECTGLLTVSPTLACRLAVWIVRRLDYTGSSSSRSMGRTLHTVSCVFQKN